MFFEKVCSFDWFDETSGRLSFHENSPYGKEEKKVFFKRFAPFGLLGVRNLWLRSFVLCWLNANDSKCKEALNYLGWIINRNSVGG